MKRVSIKDIARLAEVSVATVSYVLNKKHSGRVSEQTIEKILNIAETINYVPNKNAQSLKTNKTKLLGLIIADISNEFYSNIARQIEDRARQFGFSLIIGSSDENVEKFENLIELFTEQQVDGLIVAPVAGSDASLNKLIKKKYPIVTIDRFLKNIDIPGVMINNEEISELATTVLVSKEFSQIIYVGYKTELTHLLDRERGFDKSLNLIGKNIDVRKIYVGLEDISSEVYDLMLNSVGKAPQNTAILFSSNKLAVAGLKFLVRNGIKVPEQVSVIAFDETESYSLFPTEISFVKQPMAEMADEVLKLLLDQINDYKSTAKKITLSATLVQKDSIRL